MTNPHKNFIAFDDKEFALATRSILRSIASQDKWKKPSKKRRRELWVSDNSGDLVRVEGKLSIVEATLLFGLVYFDFNIPKSTNFLTRFFAFVDFAEEDGVEWDQFGGDDADQVSLPEDTLALAANMAPQALEDFMVEDIHHRAKRLKRKYRRCFRST